MLIDFDVLNTFPTCLMKLNSVVFKILVDARYQRHLYLKHGSSRDAFLWIIFLVKIEFREACLKRNHLMINMKSFTGLYNMDGQWCHRARKTSWKDPPRPPIFNLQLLRGLSRWNIPTKAVGISLGFFFSCDIIDSP